MNRIVTKAALGLLVGGAVFSALAGGPDVPPAPMVTPGLYVGLGGSWNTVDVTSVVDTDRTATGVRSTSSDTEHNSDDRLAPMGQIGYWAPIDSEWLWGLQANYKYLNAKFEGNFLSNAVTALNDEYLSVRITHELFLMAYFGLQYSKGYFYLGAGPVMFRAEHRTGDQAFGVTSGTTTRHSATVFSNTKTVWGGGAQLGYNYYFKPDWFLGFNYTYVVTGTNSILGFTAPAAQITNLSGTGTTTVDSKITDLTVQEIMFSINKVFAV